MPKIQNSGNNGSTLTPGGGCNGGNCESNQQQNNNCCNGNGGSNNSYGQNNHHNGQNLNNSINNQNGNNQLVNGGGNNLNNCGPKNRICRDFVKGLCRRKQCRYPHVLSPDLVVFCHDYQNSNCPRMNCKFLHYSLQEEEYYRKFGEFPQDYLMGNENNGINGLIGQQNLAQPQLQNLCKDYMIYGSCRHRECYLSTVGSPVSLGRDRMSELSPMWNDIHPAYRINDRLMNDYRNDDFQTLKRSARSVVDALDPTVQFKRYRDDNDRCIDVMAVIRRFEEEQIMLRRRVEANEIKIAELRASNEYLMTQSAQLRLNSQVVQQQHQQQQQVQVQPQQCSTVVNPVTVTQTTSQPQTAQVIGTGVSIAPVQVQATPIVSIATPQTQIITNGGGTPLALAAANTSQGQQLATIQQNITTLSNNSQPIAQTAQQILGTSQITLAPAIAQGASMGLTINTSQALAMSNATQPIISYPVMTHSILPHCNN